MTRYDESRRDGEEGDGANCRLLCHRRPLRKILLTTEIKKTLRLYLVNTSLFLIFSTYTCALHAVIKKPGIQSLEEDIEGEKKLNNKFY